jgi:dipeptidyl aminopeptidase/acylaminoacyl peptidase
MVKTSKWMAAAIVVTVALVWPSGATAQAKRLLTLVDAINVPRVSDPQLSPDGTSVLFVKDEADWKANQRIAHIFRVGSDGSNLIQLTRGDRGESTPRWSPDGKTIALLARRGESDVTQLALIPTGAGEARVATKHATAVTAPAWAPSGDAVYFLAADPKTEAEKQKDALKDDVYAFSENFKQVHLWRVGVTSGVEEQITSGDYSILAFSISEDGRRLVVHRAPSPNYGDSDRGEVWVMDSDGAHAVQLTKNAVVEAGAVLSPDNVSVLFLAQANERFEPYYNRKIFVVPAAGGTPRLVSPSSMPYEVERALWSRDGRVIYFLANMGVHAELFEMPASGGTPRQLTNGAHTVGSWTYTPAGHVFTVDEPTNPGDIWTLAPGSAESTRVTRVFDYLPRDFDLAREERIHWKGADGVSVDGLLVYPVGYQAGRRYPLVVQTHGGPQASDKFGFGHWIYNPQGYAAKGYAVLQINYRGSTGYGDPFLRDMVGHYFQNAHLDVLAGVDAVIAMGVADPERLVKMGWSGGGHMTNKIITVTDRFKAASSGAGASNWISMYGQSDVRTYRTPWFGGTPWQPNAPIDVYWGHSPLKDVARVKTPTLFFVGEADVRVPMPQSVEMYRALQSNGVPTHLYAAPREPHVFGELRHQLFKMNAELEWFEKYAIGRAYVWEQAPDSSVRQPSSR